MMAIVPFHHQIQIKECTPKSGVISRQFFFFFFRFQIFAIRRQAEASDVEIILGPTQSLECWGKKHLFER